MCSLLPLDIGGNFHSTSTSVENNKSPSYYKSYLPTLTKINFFRFLKFFSIDLKALRMIRRLPTARKKTAAPDRDGGVAALRLPRGKNETIAKSATLSSHGYFTRSRAFISGWKSFLLGSAFMSGTRNAATMPAEKPVL